MPSKQSSISSVYLLSKWFFISSVKSLTLSKSRYFYMLRFKPVLSYGMNAALYCISEWIIREWLSCWWSGLWPLAVLCWPEFSLGLPQIRWHPGVEGSVVRPSSTRTELASTRDSWTLCAAPAPASVPGHCRTSARTYTQAHTHTHGPDQGG